MKIMLLLAIMLSLKNFVVIRENTVIGDNTIIRAGAKIGGTGLSSREWIMKY